MSVITHDCPHCRSERMTQQILAWDQMNDVKGHVFVKCAGCGMGSVATVFGADTKIPFSSLRANNRAPESAGYRVVRFYPTPLAANIPEHLPVPLEGILREAEDARARKKPHSAGLTYGKALDVAFKRFDPGIKGTLHSRIDQLGKTGKLTPELAQWAMGLKVVRNDATHEEEPFDEKDIEAIAEATHLILQYLFTMPERLKALKAATTSKTP